MDEQISSILSIMSGVLDNEQLGTLHVTLVKVLSNPEETGAPRDNTSQLETFLAAKSIEGCSKKTIAYYELTISKALTAIDKPVLRMTTQDLRSYLSDYQVRRGSSAVTINNMRRVLSSFFSWLEDEGSAPQEPDASHQSHQDADQGENDFHLGTGGTHAGKNFLHERSRNYRFAEHNGHARERACRSRS